MVVRATRIAAASADAAANTLLRTPPVGSPSLTPVALSAPPPPVRRSLVKLQWVVLAGSCAAAAVLGVFALRHARSVPELRQLGERLGAQVEATLTAKPSHELGTSSELKKPAPSPDVVPARTADSQVLDLDDLPTAETAQALSVDELPIAASKTSEPRPSRHQPARAVAPKPKVETSARVLAAQTGAPAEGPSNTDEAAQGAAKTKGVVHVDASPGANVVVDGHPLGLTPKTVRLLPGAHTIVFAGPEGRALREVNVEPGGEQTVSVAF
jgi:hypothetical protein